MRDFMNTPGTEATEKTRNIAGKRAQVSSSGASSWCLRIVRVSVYVQNTMPYSVCLCGLCASVVMESRRETPHRGIRYAVDGPCRHATPRGGKRQGL